MTDKSFQLNHTNDFGIIYISWQKSTILCQEYLSNILIILSVLLFRQLSSIKCSCKSWTIKIAIKTYHYLIKILFVYVIQNKIWKRPQ